MRTTTTLFTLGLVLSVGCAGQRSTPKLEATYSFPGELGELRHCSQKMPCKKGEECVDGFCVSRLFYQDDTDNGDEPFRPGCHRRYTDAACSKNKTLHQGDGCLTGRILFEWTNKKCHGAQNDFKFYDCDKLCRETVGSPAGFCEVVKLCGPGQTSAKCTCN